MKKTSQLKLILLSTVCFITSFSSCNKKSTSTNAEESNYYKVPITITFSGKTFTSQIGVLYGVQNNACAGNGWGATTDYNANCTFILNGFSVAGGAVNGGRSNCDRANVELSKGVNGNDGVCFSKRDDNGTLSLSGKTYTLSCSVWIYEDRDVNGVEDGIYADVEYPLKAVWTKP